MSPAFFTSGDPSSRRKGILTADFQYSSHQELPFTAPPHQANRLVGHPSHTPQYHGVSVFHPMVSDVPSMPPPSFYTPLPHHPRRPPASFGYPPYEPRPLLPSVLSARVDIQPVAVPTVSPMSYVQPGPPSPYIIPVPPPDIISEVPQNVHSPRKKLIRTWGCPFCPKTFGRPQDRNRHLPSHLPYCICCSYDGCSWRGYRIDIFRNHLHSEHQATIQLPDESVFNLYDPRPLVKAIVQGNLSREEAQRRDATMIKEIATRRDKEALLKDPWSRKREDWKGSQKYSRFTETSAPLTTSSTSAFSSVPPTKLWESAPVPRNAYTEARTDRDF